MWLAMMPEGRGVGVVSFFVGLVLFGFFLNLFMLIFCESYEQWGKYTLTEWVKVYERWEGSTLASKQRHSILVPFSRPTQAAYSCGHDFHGLPIFKTMHKYNDSSCLQRSKTIETYIAVFLSVKH